MSDHTDNQASPIVCDLSVFTASQRAQHAITTKALFASAQAMVELPDGYAFRLPDDSATLRQAVDFIASERQCCPFIAFSLSIEANGAGVWLRLTGSEDVKRLLAMEFRGYLADWSIRGADL